MNRSVPQTLHCVFAQELTSLLDTILAGEAVSDRATAERLVRALGALSHVHQRHVIDAYGRCQVCWGIGRRSWRPWPRRTECSVHAALSFFLHQQPGHVLSVPADQSATSANSREEW